MAFADSHPHTSDDPITTDETSNESIVFDAAGNYYVGHADGNQDVQKFSPTDTPLATYDVEVEERGSDWIDLAADQKTLFYTSEGSTIKRFDVSTNTQLPDFATDLTQTFALRLLPPGDGSNGLLVANTVDIKRLDSNGEVVQTYDAPDENFWFALNLDPNGTSFWSARHSSGNFYRFNIATGDIELGPIDSGEGDSIAGLCLKGEPTAATPPEEPPPSESTEDHAVGFVGPEGGSVSTTGPATKDNPHTTKVTIPPGFPGTVTINETDERESVDDVSAAQAPACIPSRPYTCLVSDITTTQTTTRKKPMIFRFTLDKTVVNVRLRRLRVEHDGRIIPRCDDEDSVKIGYQLEQGQESCHAKTVRVRNRDVRLLVLSIINGRWRFR